MLTVGLAAICFLRARTLARTLSASTATLIMAALSCPTLLPVDLDAETPAVFAFFKAGVEEEDELSRAGEEEDDIGIKGRGKDREKTGNRG